MKHLIKGTTYDSVLNQINNGELKTKPLIISTQDDGGDTNCFFLPKRQVHFKHEITNELIELIKLVNTNVELQMIGLSSDGYELTNDGYIYDSFVVNGVEMTQPLSEIITTEYGPKYIENEQRSVIHNLDNVIPFNSNEDIVGVFDEKLTSDNPYVSIILGLYNMIYFLLAHSPIKEVCENENAGLTFNDKNLTISKDFALNVAKLVIGEDAPAELLESYGFSVHLLFSNTKIEGIEFLREGASRNAIKILYADNLLPLTIDYKFTGNDYDVIKFNNKNINWVHDFFITFERQLKDDDYFFVYGQIFKISSDFMTALWTTSDNQTFYPNLMFVEYFIHMYDESFLPIFDVDGNRIKYKLSYRSGGTPTIITVPLKPSEIDVVAEISPMLYKKNINSVVGALYEWWQEDNYDGYTTAPTLSHSYLIAGSGGIHLYNKSFGIKEIELPNDISFIPGCFCENMSNLKTINIPKSVTKILGWAFNGCTNLQNIKLHNNITQINNNAFQYCTSLTSVTIPSSVTSIGGSVFRGCTSLTSVTIGNGVTTIGNTAFSGCYFERDKFINNSSATGYPWGANLYDVVQDDGLCINGTTAVYCRPNTTNVTIPSSVTSIGSQAFQYCTSLTSVTIPSSVTSIGDDVFYKCYNLTSVTIPDSITEIGYGAFSGCYFERDKFINNSSATGYPWGANLCDVVQNDGLCIDGTTAVDCKPNATNVTIPSSVTSIANSAFYNCTSLTSITIPDSVTSIDDSALSDTPFYNNLPNGDVYLGSCYYKYKGEMPSNTSITIKDGTKSISSYAFSGCRSLTSVTIPNSVTSIGSNAFSNCSGLTSIVIPDSVTSISNSAFYGCTRLRSVTIPSSVTRIGNSTFSSCRSLISVTIGSGVTSIGTYAFSNCSSLTSVTIPDSVTSIDSNAFSNCSSLTSVTIPDSVTSIDSNAFNNCSSLTSVTIPSSATSISDSAFYGCYFERDKFINNSSLIDSNNWGANLYDIIQDDGLCINGTTAVDCRPNATNVTIPSSVIKIDCGAFFNCTSLTSITITDNVKYIYSQAFYNCSSLTSVVIPDSITTIYGSAFSGCTSLTSIEIPSSVTSIGSSAFTYCSSLTSVTIPDSVTSIGGSVFRGCTSLTSVTIGNGVTTISRYAFDDCKSLTSVIIPSSVTKIGEHAFSDCSSLTSITIPDSVRTIDSYAFIYCSSLSSITCHATTAPSLGNYSVFVGLPTNGTLYAPNGSNYSSWSSKLPSGWTIEYK